MQLTPSAALILCANWVDENRNSSIRRFDCIKNAHSNYAMHKQKGDYLHSHNADDEIDILNELVSENGSQMCPTLAGIKIKILTAIDFRAKSLRLSVLFILRSFSTKSTLKILWYHFQFRSNEQNIWNPLFVHFDAWLRRNANVKCANVCSDCLLAMTF